MAGIVTKVEIVIVITVLQKSGALNGKGQTMNKLKRCPFCGGKAEYISRIDVYPILDENGAYIDADTFYYEVARCKKCGVGYESADDNEPEEITIER